MYTPHCVWCGILINAHQYSLHRKEMEEPELVYSDEANTAIPQMVIKFYESKLTWNEVPEEEQRRYIHM